MFRLTFDRNRDRGSLSELSHQSHVTSKGTLAVVYDFDCLLQYDTAHSHLNVHGRQPDATYISTIPIHVSHYHTVSLAQPFFPIQHAPIQLDQYHRAPRELVGRHGMRRHSCRLPSTAREYRCKPVLQVSFHPQGDEEAEAGKSRLTMSKPSNTPSTIPAENASQLN